MLSDRLILPTHDGIKLLSVCGTLFRENKKCRQRNADNTPATNMNGPVGNCYFKVYHKNRLLAVVMARFVSVWIAFKDCHIKEKLVFRKPIYRAVFFLKNWADKIIRERFGKAI